MFETFERFSEWIKKELWQRKQQTGRSMPLRDVLQMTWNEARKDRSELIAENEKLKAQVDAMQTRFIRVAQGDPDAIQSLVAYGAHSVHIAALKAHLRPKPLTALEVSSLRYDELIRAKRTGTRFSPQALEAIQLSAQQQAALLGETLKFSPQVQEWVGEFLEFKRSRDIDIKPPVKLTNAQMQEAHRLTTIAPDDARIGANFGGVRDYD